MKRNKKTIEKLVLGKQVIVKLNSAKLNVIVGGAPGDTTGCGSIPGTQHTTIPTNATNLCA
jgi:hypothetical protein